MPLKQAIPSNSSIVNGVRILAVDNDCDSGALYTALFESYSVTVTTTESIKTALNLLNRFVPDILICEARFLGESVDPLIQRVRSIAQARRKLIPILVISTYPTKNLTEHLKVNVEAYQVKPIDLDQFLAQVWKLILLSRIMKPLTEPMLIRRESSEIPHCGEDTR